MKILLKIIYKTAKLATLFLSYKKSKVKVSQGYHAFATLPNFRSIFDKIFTYKKHPEISGAFQLFYSLTVSYGQSIIPPNSYIFV
jgi:hypothetical protein